MTAPASKQRLANAFRHYLHKWNSLANRPELAPLSLALRRNRLRYGDHLGVV